MCARSFLKRGIYTSVLSRAIKAVRAGRACSCITRRDHVDNIRRVVSPFSGHFTHSTFSLSLSVYRNNNACAARFDEKRVLQYALKIVLIFISLHIIIILIF